MGEETIDVIESEEFKTPEIKTRLQAFSMMFTAISFFWSNDKKKVIFLLVALFAVALILYNNIDLITEIYNLPKHFAQ
jgi:hypothetical protein